MTRRLILFREMIVVYFETNYVDGRHVGEVQSLKVQVGGTYGYHCALK